MPELPVVEKQVATNDPAKQVIQIQAGVGGYSHDDELPLKVRIKRTSWLGRKISVTTTELVWYRDAITYIEVPAGFTYDLASIPRPVWLLVSPWDIALESLFHDLLYRKQEVKRRVADTTLQSMMQDRGVPFLIRWSVYLGVRIGGWSAWNQRAAENAAAKKLAQNVAADNQIPIDTPSTIAPDNRETEAERHKRVWD